MRGKVPIAKLYIELEWTNLYDRRWFRRLCHFVNLWKSHYKAHLLAELPGVGKVSYSLKVLLHGNIFALKSDQLM